MSSLSSRIADRLVRERQAAGLTQDEVARRAGVTSQYVSRLERAVSDAPRRVELGKVAAVFGLTADDLMGLDDQPEPADDNGPSDDEINAAISELLADTGVMLAFMSDVRDPGRLSRTVRLDILSRLRALKARQQRQQG